MDVLLRALLNDPELLENPSQAPTLEDFLQLVTEHAEETLAEELRILVTEPLELDLALLFAGLGVPIEDRGPSASPRFGVDPEPWKRHTSPH